MAEPRRVLARFIALYGMLYCAFGFASPFLPAFLAERGLAPDTLGLVLAAGTAVRLISGPLAGRLADVLHAFSFELAAFAAGAAAALGGPTVELLPPGFLVSDLSQDGSAAAGNVVGDGTYETFRWTRQGGVERLGLATVPVVGTGAGTPDISYDGSRISATILSSDGNGTQVNVSGAVIAKFAPNKDNAEKLVEFLLSDEAQHLDAGGNYEFPVVPGVAPSDLVASWGELKADKTPLTEIAAHRKEASALVDELRFDEGPQD